MRTPTRALLTLPLFALASSALAWLPGLDDATAKAIVDGVYRRGPDVPTSTSLSLQVKNGAFEGGAKAVDIQDGPATCLSDWLARPTDYAKFGSRPVNVAAAGQSDYAKAAALEARDNFKNLTAAAALEAARKGLPDGHLRVFIRMEGLPQENARDAYQVAALDANAKVVAPYKITFLDDWKQVGGTWGGTMVYYLDLKGRATGSGTLPVLLRTEADSECAYRINVNLAAFK